MAKKKPIEEKPISEEEQIRKDVLDITEEIQRENKEIIDIIQSDLYKTLFQVLNRVTLKMEITNIDKISLPGEKIMKSSPGFKSTTKKGKTESMMFQNITLVDQSEKAYKFRNDDFEILWNSKKGCKYNEDTKELEVLGWWIDFVNKTGDGIEFKTE